MGLDYSIDLYFPIENIKRALEATNVVCADFGVKTTIILPDGDKTVVSFPKNWNNEEDSEIDLFCPTSCQFTTSLYFLPDEHLKMYYEGRELENYKHHINGVLHYRVGYIYMGIRCSSNYACFSYTAATSQMSRLFVESTSVHQQFQMILQKAQGLFGHIDIETMYEYIPLERPKLRIVPQKSDLPDDIHHVDWMVQAGLETLTYQRKQWQKQGNAESFYQKWVEPFTDILSWEHKLDVEKAKEAILKVKKYISDVDDTVIKLLLEDSHPIYKQSAAWLVGLGKFNQLLPDIIKYANQSDWHLRYMKYAYSFSLAQLGHSIPSHNLGWWEARKLRSEIAELISVME